MTIRRSSDRIQAHGSPQQPPRVGSAPPPAPKPVPVPERIPQIVFVPASCGHEVEARDDTPESRIQVIRQTPCKSCRVAANQAANDEASRAAAEVRREKATKGFPVRGEEFMHLPDLTRLYGVKTPEGWEVVFTMPDKADHKGTARGLHYALINAAKSFYRGIVNRRHAEAKARAQASVESEA